MLEVLTCLVLYVHDPDTPVMDCGAGAEYVRVANIDSPELTGDCLAEVMAADMGKFIASTVLDGAEVELQVLYRDRWGRRVGHVLLDGVDYGEQIVDAGIAVEWLWREDGSGPVVPNSRPQWCESRSG